MMMQLYRISIFGRGHFEGLKIPGKLELNVELNLSLVLDLVAFHLLCSQGTTRRTTAA